MEINSSFYKNILPLVKEYKKGVGIHIDQDVKNERLLNNSISAIIRNKELRRIRKDYSYCSANLFNLYIVGDVILLQIQPLKEGLSEEAFNSYIEWVVVNSPWRHAFLTKNITNILKDRVVVMNPNSPKWYLKEAAIALRMAWENYSDNGKYKKVALWYELSKKMCPKMSFIVGFLMFTNEGNNIVKSGSVTGHTPLNYYHGLPSPGNFRINGWYREELTQSGWSKSRRYKSMTIIINDLFDTMAINNVKNNPFSNIGCKTVPKDIFLKEMTKKISKRWKNV